MLINKKLKISVIIPTYNRENTIEQCIKSVINQTIKVNEIIIIDDCSTDNTVNKIGHFSDIILLKTENNSGAQAARNQGIKAAQSKWIAFIDSDDEWLTDKLEKQLNVLKSENFNPLSVVHGDCIVRNTNTGKEKTWHLDKIDGENVHQQLLLKSGTFFPSILTSKLALEKIGYLDEKVPSFQEWDTAIKLSKICTFKHIQEPLFIYNIQNSNMSNCTANNLDGYYYIINKYEDDIKNICGNQVFDEHIINCGNMALNSSQFRYARQLLNKISNKSYKNILLVMLSYLRIKSKYLYHLKNYLSWKNQ